MQALVYSNNSQECERAKQLLESLGQDIREFLLDVDFTDKQFRAEFGQAAEYPQISVGLNHRGSLKETLNFLKKEGMFV
jgi:glutaredoxin|tara:strand:- start:1879 stop:2115 length:237 start_codon:yes stop_codon:yes gene_type:complete